MIPLREFWHNGGKRLLVILIVISSIIFLLVAGIVLGIFVLDGRIRTVKGKVAEVAGNQENISKRVKDNTDALKEYEKSVNESWVKFQDHNPTFPVPQVSETDPNVERKADIVVIPAKSKPKPSSTPKIHIQKQKVYVTKPKDWPFWKPWPPTSTPRPKKK